MVSDDRTGGPDDPSPPPARALIEITPELQQRLRDPRIVIGWVLIAAGAIAVFLGYWGVSDTLDPGKQLPYIISGGIGGLFLLGFGAAMLFSSDLADARRQVGETRELVEQLRAELAAGGRSANGHDVATAVTPAASANGHRTLALPTGTTFHRPDCSVLAGKAEAAEVDTTDVERRKLTACRICEPAV